MDTGKQMFQLNSYVHCLLNYFCFSDTITFLRSKRFTFFLEFPQVWGDKIFKCIELKCFCLKTHCRSMCMFLVLTYFLKKDRQKLSWNQINQQWVCFPKRHLWICSNYVETHYTIAFWIWYFTLLSLSTLNSNSDNDRDIAWHVWQEHSRLNASFWVLNQLLTVAITSWSDECRDLI